MNFLKRRRHDPERDQEQLLVRLWTINTMNADAYVQLASPESKLASDAATELMPSFKYLSTPELEQTVNDAAYHHQLAYQLKKHLNDGRRPR